MCVCVCVCVCVKKKKDKNDAGLQSEECRREGEQVRPEANVNKVEGLPPG